MKNSHFDVLLATTPTQTQTETTTTETTTTNTETWYTEGGERFANTPFTKKQWRKATIEEKIEYIGTIADPERASSFLRFFVVTENELNDEELIAVTPKTILRQVKSIYIAQREEILTPERILRTLMQTRHIVLSQLSKEQELIVRKFAKITIPQTTPTPKVLPQFVAKTQVFDENTTRKLVEWAQQKPTNRPQVTQPQQSTDFTPPIKLLNHNSKIAKITRSKPEPTKTKIEVEDNGTITHTTIARKTKTHLQSSINRAKLLAEAQALAERYNNDSN